MNEFLPNYIYVITCTDNYDTSILSIWDNEYQAEEELERTSEIPEMQGSDGLNFNSIMKFELNKPYENITYEK